MATMRYRLEDINRIKQQGFSYELTKETQELIMNLSKLVGSPDYIKTPTFQKRRKDNSGEPDWDLIKQFKPTAKVERTDNEQLMQDIKGSMNKMTDKNYETLRVDILTKLGELENTDVYDRILDIIFNVASSNRFYSKVYATLYKELMEKSSEVFSLRMNTELSNYISRFLTIVTVNASDDYEAFCENNKKNEEHKALTEFFVHLMSMDVISVDKLVSVYSQLVDQVNSNIDNGEQKHTVIELSENIFILINSGAVFFNDAGKLDEMMSLISGITKMKATDHPGLSNKSLFKFMDVMDIKV
jgi:hypothetical protein